MIRVRFRNPDGTVRTETDAPAGTVLLHLAQGLGLPLEGTCEGAMACSTCHVLIARADWPKLPPAGPHEEDMLDFAAHVGPTSRLACQIVLTDDMESLDVQLPAGHSNMLGR